MHGSAILKRSAVLLFFFVLFCHYDVHEGRSPLLAPRDPEEDSVEKACGERPGRPQS